MNLSIVQSTATDAPLTRTQKIAYGAITVGGQYVLERLNHIVAAQGWGDLPEVDLCLCMAIIQLKHSAKGAFVEEN